MTKIQTPILCLLHTLFITIIEDIWENVQEMVPNTVSSSIPYTGTETSMLNLSMLLRLHPWRSHHHIKGVSIQHYMVGTQDTPLTFTLFTMPWASTATTHRVQFRERRAVAAAWCP